MEFEVMEEGKFAAVFSKSSFRGKNICNHFTLIKNADGCYVEAQPRDFNKAPVKWLKKVNDKIRRSNAQDDSEKIDISDITD